MNRLTHVLVWFWQWEIFQLLHISGNSFYVFSLLARSPNENKFSSADKLSVRTCARLEFTIIFQCYHQEWRGTSREAKPEKKREISATAWWKQQHSAIQIYAQSLCVLTNGNSILTCCLSSVYFLTASSYRLLLNCERGIRNIHSRYSVRVCSFVYIYLFWFWLGFGTFP